MTTQNAEVAGAVTAAHIDVYDTAKVGSVGMNNSVPGESS